MTQRGQKIQQMSILLTPPSTGHEGNGYTAVHFVPYVMRSDFPLEQHRSTGLVEVLDRVLDKGLLVAGDIRVSLAEVELLTIRIRLIICSIDKAQEIGLDWWRYDQNLAPGRDRDRLSTENEALKRQVRKLERQIARGSLRSTVPASRPAGTRTRRLKSR